MFKDKVKVTVVALVMVLLMVLSITTDLFVGLADIFRAKAEEATPTDATPVTRDVTVYKELNDSDKDRNLAGAVIKVFKDSACTESMDTVTLGVDCRGNAKSVKTIIAYLHNIGFLPCADSKLFDNVFESICKAVDEVFAERTIDDFIAERMLIFISALVKEGYDVSVLQQLNVRDISFPVIVNVLGVTDVKRLAHLFMVFTQRFYGAALPMQQNYDLIRRWLDGSV